MRFIVSVPGTSSVFHDPLSNLTMYHTQGPTILDQDFNNPAFDIKILSCSVKQTDCP